MVPISDVRKVGGGGFKHTPVLKKQQAVESKGDSTAAMANSLLADAVESGASAIHIEPHHSKMLVRYRIDGLLHKGKAIPETAVPHLSRRLKKIAGMNTVETRVPQQGRFNTVFNNHAYAVRVHTLPVEGGEKIVMHMSEQSGTPHSLEKLGYWGSALLLLQQIKDLPKGLVLVGGPTGSGKTATLYALLGIANKPTLSAATVEDVVEHRLTGISQTSAVTKANLSYAETLRAVLQQDPNILLVSDVREPDTASQVVHAALGGRLVFAGIQSPDLAATMAHLVALQAEPYTLASSVRVIINQRLVRRLCPACREIFTPSAKEFDALCKAVGLAPQGTRAHLTNLQSIAAADLGVAPATLAGGKINLWRAHEKGCGVCGGRGYKGRIIIAEAMKVNQPVQKLIMSGVTGAPIYDQAMQDEMVPLPLDGLVKTVLGITSADEVLRAIKA